MSAESDNQVLRLRKKHAPGSHAPPVAKDGERLINAQSLTHALMAGFIATVLFAVIWSMLTNTSGRVFPWLTMFLGVLVGFAVRRAGQGLDWRFPVVAAGLAIVGSVFGNIVLAAGTSARELGSSTLVVLREVTFMTWPIFFEEAMRAADWVFAAVAAVVAAFLANRRLNRREYQALRIWQEKEATDRTGDETRE